MAITRFAVGAGLMGAVEKSDMTGIMGASSLIPDVVEGLRLQRQLWRRSQQRDTDRRSREFPSFRALECVLLDLLGVLFPLRNHRPQCQAVSGCHTGCETVCTRPVRASD